jgi:hypothetical protein
VNRDIQFIALLQAERVFIPTASTAGKPTNDAPTWFTGFLELGRFSSSADAYSILMVRGIRRRKQRLFLTSTTCALLSDALIL